MVGLMWAAGVAQGYAAAHAVNTLPFARASLGLSEGQMSGLLSVTRIGALLALLFSIRGDARGRRGPFLAAFALLMAASAATGLSNGPALFAASQTATRMGATAAGILGAVMLIETVSKGLRAYALSLYAGATSLGAGLATIALAVADLGPEAWRFVFASSLLGVGLVVPLLRWLKPTTMEPGVPGDWWQQLTLRTRRNFFLLAGASYSLATFLAVAVSFSFERLVDDLGLSATSAALLALTGGTLGGLGFLVGGRLADTWGRKRTALVAMGLAVAGSVALYQLTALPLVGLAIFVSSAGSFMLAPALGALRNETFSAHVRSRAVTWINNMAVMGSVTGLTFGQATIDEIGLSASVTRLAPVALVAFCLIPFVPETRPHVASTEPRRR